MNVKDVSMWKANKTPLNGAKTLKCFNCPDSAGQRGHGLDNQSLGNFDNFNSYGRNIFFAASKIFGRFRNEVPKVKYCRGFTKGDFSQSSLKVVIILFDTGIRSN